MFFVLIFFILSLILGLSQIETQYFSWVELRLYTKFKVFNLLQQIFLELNRIKAGRGGVDNSCDPNFLLVG